MLPAGPLMIEHRLIERMIVQMTKEKEAIEKEGSVDLNFLSVAVDFLSNYADRCHHGKEEDILFRALKTKPLSAEHKAILDRLIDDHVMARKEVGALRKAIQEFSSKGEGRDDIVAALRTLIQLYPAHIALEDKKFFLPAMDYFTPEERNSMLEEFADFDRKLIHERYRVVIEQLENEKK